MVINQLGTIFKVLQMIKSVHKHCIFQTERSVLKNEAVVPGMAFACMGVCV